jgi:hypothetical protein
MPSFDPSLILANDLALMLGRFPGDDPISFSEEEVDEVTELPVSSETSMFAELTEKHPG